MGHHSFLSFNCLDLKRSGTLEDKLPLVPVLSIGLSYVIIKFF